jgi:hypothetical protein
MKFHQLSFKKRRVKREVMKQMGSKFLSSVLSVSSVVNFLGSVLQMPNEVAFFEADFGEGGVFVIG